MRTTTLASSITALVAMLAISTTSAVPVEKRLMMALSLQASPTIPSLDLGGLMPTPTIPDIAGEVQSMITSIIDGVTTLIPTMIPSPTIPAELQNMIPGVTIAVAAPTPPPEVDVLAKLAQGALNAFPSMLMKNLEEIQSMASSAIAAAATATATATPTPVVYVTTEDGKECTKTYTPSTPTFATSGVINPLSILMNALPQPTGVMNEVTSVIGGVTSVLKLPAPPLPTGLLPLLGTMELPQIDLPGLMGDKQNACIKDGQGNQIGLCASGPLINDSETIAL
ncbi:uncharacterized protein UTRI_01504_B [Ustilago trichophora]|uniref:Uncharacterized protein n=1 Tax=Ustilago trichophora TaxID=86804 RepID=A0A5C3E387_9BASI|nr:uncharacterized protein UTRI_01504_B [Ustilago trichophora]